MPECSGPDPAQGGAFLRSVGLLDLHATPIQQGRTLQLWLVEITNGQGKTVARGQVRLINQPLP